CEGRGCGRDAVAKIEEVSGQVDRDHAGEEGKYEPATGGELLAMGDAVRTGAASSAGLRLRGGGRLVLEESTLLRFAKDGEGSAVELVMGEAEVEAEGTALSFRTGSAQAHLGKNDRVRLTTDRVSVKMTSLTGPIRVQTEGGGLVLKEGATMDLGAEGLVLGKGVVEVNTGEQGASPTEETAGVARLTVTAGQLEVRSAKEGPWVAVEEGETRGATPGTVLRVPKGAAASVARGGAMVSLEGPGQFQVGSPGDPIVRALSGKVVLVGSMGAASVTIPGGEVRADQGARGTIVVSARGTTVSVELGRAQVIHRGGEELVSVGEKAVVGSEGDLEEGTGQPGRSHFTAPVGESFTLHDPSPPSVVGFRLGALCERGGVVEVLRGRRVARRFGGTSVVRVPLPVGRTSYRVRCAGESGLSRTANQQGTVRVVRDSGMLALPRSAPTSDVEVDGRNYRVTYQNLLPGITVRWRDAPAATRYVIRITTAGGKKKTVEASGSTHTFGSGDLGDGTHILVYEALGNTKEQSRATRLAIVFDNAAPKARVTAPRTGSFRPGETVPLAGSALAGWDVSVGGTPLPLDRQGRFNHQGVVPPNQDGIAIRLAHRSRGVHYYLRKVGPR
ncbi:MAG: hypothetical protein KC416_12205, partial [Myxococcales bacterium]|nr:hypothetical protein [Myxococcales bacterium]